MTEIAREAIAIVSDIRSTRSSETKSAASLRKLLRGALGKFEKALSALPAEQRAVAESLYLDRIRKVTFYFHLAMQTEVATQKARGSTRDGLDQVLLHNEAACFEIARLYGFE